MRKMFITLMTLATAAATSQTVWTARQCMQYAVEHNTRVRQASLELDNYEASRLAAAGRFLPSVSADVGMQYNFGRAIDPETNGYTDVSTFYNGYAVGTTLPVFDGFSRLHALRAAKASVLMGRNALREQQDQTALATLQAWADAVYYEGMVTMAEEKVAETALLLRQTRLLEEVGRKSAADVALVESQQAEADYELTRQQNLLASSLLTLKKDMGLPLGDSIKLTVSPEETDSFPGGNYQFPRGKLFAAPYQSHPQLLGQYYAMRSKLYEWHQARASLFPSLSVSAGLSTTYYHTLHTPSASSFSSQIKNNMGEYLGATLSIPLFSRLQTLTSIRRAKNNYRMAQEAYAEKQQELEKLCREAWQDWLGYQKQARQMEKKVEADSLAYQLTRRQFEEGLATAIDLHTTSSQLLQSQATLLQCRLMAMLKQELVRYYNGETIWTE